RLLDRLLLGRLLPPRGRTGGRPHDGQGRDRERSENSLFHRVISHERPPAAGDEEAARGRLRLYENRPETGSPPPDPAEPPPASRALPPAPTAAAPKPALIGPAPPLDGPEQRPARSAGGQKKKRGPRKGSPLGSIS